MNLGELIQNLKSVPAIANNPTKLGWLNTLQEAVNTGDFSKAENLANNLCQSHGVSKDQAQQMASNFFFNSNK